MAQATIDKVFGGAASVDPARLKEALLAKGSIFSEADIDGLYRLVDTDADGTLSRLELRAGLSQALAGAPGLERLLALHDTSSATVDFSELKNANHTAVKIVDTAERAVTLGQLGLVLGHVEKRVEREAWIGQREGKGAGKGGWTTVKLTLPDVNLYDCLKYVIKPATLADRCSLVELMAEGPQLPDYFVSHWWGEAIVEFLDCLVQHATDRREDLTATRYWVCAHGACVSGPLHMCVCEPGP